MGNGRFFGGLFDCFEKQTDFPQARACFLVGLLLVSEMLQRDELVQGDWPRCFQGNA